MLEPIVGVRARARERLAAPQLEHRRADRRALRPGVRHPQPSGRARGRELAGRAGARRRARQSSRRDAAGAGRHAGRRPPRRPRRRSRASALEPQLRDDQLRDRQGRAPHGEAARRHRAPVGRRRGRRRPRGEDRRGGASRRARTKPRTPAEMQKIQQIVATAVGLDATRGDQITVENVAFDDAIASRCPSRRSMAAPRAELVSSTWRSGGRR